MPYFRARDEPLGVHPFLRLYQPRGLRDMAKCLAPGHVLVGHGEGIHGEGAAAVLAQPSAERAAHDAALAPGSTAKEEERERRPRPRQPVPRPAPAGHHGTRDGAERDRPPAARARVRPRLVVPEGAGAPAQRRRAPGRAPARALAACGRHDRRAVRQRRLPCGASAGRFRFLSTSTGRVAEELDLLELTDETHRPFLPFTFVLDSRLVIARVWCGFWYWGTRPPTSCGWRCARSSRRAAELRAADDLGSGRLAPPDAGIDAPVV